MFSGHRDHHLFNAGVYPAPGAGSEQAEQLPVRRQTEGLPSLPQCEVGSVRAREVKLPEVIGGAFPPGKVENCGNTYLQYCIFNIVSK